MIPVFLLAAATGAEITLSTTEFLGLLVFGGFSVNRICDSADKKKEVEFSIGDIKIRMGNNVTKREVEEFSEQRTRLNRMLADWQRLSYARQRDLVEPIFDGLKRVATPEMIAQMNRRTSKEEKMDFLNQNVAVITASRIW